MQKKISNIFAFFKDKDLISALGYSVTNVLFGLIILPFILVKLKTEEINVWLLFLSIISFSELAVMGFNSTFLRFYSYTKAGIYYKDFNHIKSVDKKNSQVNFDKSEQFNKLYTITVSVFTFISIIYFLLLLIGGYFALKTPISYLPEPSLGWIAWGLLIFANVFRVFSYTFPVILQGVNAVFLYYNIQSFFRILNIILSIGVLIFIPSLINLAFVYSLSIVLLSFAFFYYVKVKKIDGLTFRFNKFNKEIFLIIWESAWKSGTARISAPIILHASGIIFSQVATPAISSSYLLTQRVFNILQNISNTVVNSKLPKIAMLRGKKDFLSVRSLVRKISLTGYLIIVLGYLMILLTGNKLLQLIDSNTNFVSLPILILFSFAYLLNRNLGIQLSLANQANKVVEHKAILIYGIVYFIFIGINYKHLDIWIFPVAMIIGILVSMLFSFSKTYKLYQTSYWEFEKRCFIPVFFGLLIINIGVLLQ